MGYPAEWRPFLRGVFLTSEGGYVKTGSMETLFGVIDRVWVDAIDRVPDAELANVPGLQAIKDMPKSQRMGPMRAWMQKVGRELQPMGNGKQPESGQPLRSKEWVEVGGNATLVHQAQEVALGIIHRDYIKGGHFEHLPLSQETLCTVIDAAGRYGVAAAWTMVTKAANLSGYITDRQMNELGWTEAKDMREGATYGGDGGGKNYTIASRRKEVGEAMQLMHSPELDKRFFDAYGFWRRNFVSNHAPDNEKEGDMLRIQHQHGNPTAALARMASWRTDQSANWFKANAAIAEKEFSRVHALSEPVEGSLGRAVVSIPLPAARPAAHVYVQNASDGVLFGTKQLAIDIPGYGVFHYGLRESDGQIRAEGSDTFVAGKVMLLDPEKIYHQPNGVHVVPPGKQALGITNNFADSTMLVWKDQDGTVQPLVLTPELHRSALAIDMRYEWGGLAYPQDFSSRMDGQTVRLEPNDSAMLTIAKGGDALSLPMVFIEHPAGEPPQPGLGGNMKVTGLVDPAAAPQTAGPLASR